MARDKNTYAKRQRETLKRQKAEEKQERRRKRRAGPRDTDIGVMPAEDAMPAEQVAPAE